MVCKIQGEKTPEVPLKQLRGTAEHCPICQPEPKGHQSGGKGALLVHVSFADLERYV